MKHFYLSFFFCLMMALTTLCMTSAAQEHRPRVRGEAFQTETPMVHDPVMAQEGNTYYLYATGMGIQQMTSTDRKIWTVSPRPLMTVIPGWTTDSVPGFRNHVWAPDVIWWHGNWWLAYSCSTFGRNSSAIGLLSSRSLGTNLWKDEGCLVCSREKRDNWNAIDPNFVIDDATDTPWLVWGSFWDGIQIVRLDTTMHIAQGERPRTIARRYDPFHTPSEPNPTSRYAGTNAIEAPFIFKHDGYYYLFVSWDYCCRGSKSNYRVAVGRSRAVDGPYLDYSGRDMAKGGAHSSWRVISRNGKLRDTALFIHSTVRIFSSAMVTARRWTVQQCLSNDPLHGRTTDGPNSCHKPFRLKDSTYL